MPKSTRSSRKRQVFQTFLKKVAIFESQPFIGETDDLTIEHLLPQSSSKSDEDHLILGQIGNLILVDQKTNEMLSTNNFNEKRSILESRGYKLPELFEGIDKLEEEVIRENTQRISELAREEIWKV